MSQQDLFHIEKNDKVGRFAVASQDLKAGDVVFSETSFAYGPKSDSPCLCLGCHRPVEATYLCSKCSWPVCGLDCEKLPVHNRNECETFALSGAKFQPVEDPTDVCLQYECITPLRVLLSKERNPKRWEDEIAVMESHNDKRKETPIWEFNQKNVVEYLRGPCKVEKFSEELIHTVCGILDTNSFEARTPSYYMIRCLFPKLAILSHNCVSNIRHSVDCKANGELEDCGVVVRTTIDVPKGGELSSSYTFSLWPTMIRREFLRQSKFFECTCARCVDPTELGTHLSSLKCQRCDNGVIMSTNPLDDTCEWKCTHCDYKTHGGAIRRVFAAIQNDFDQVEYIGGDEGLQQRENLYKKYKSVLHPKNAYMSMLRSALTQLYGKCEGYTLQDLPDIVLERKMELCMQLLEVLNVVEPGMTRARGITLYELHGTIMVLAKHQYTYRAISKEDFVEQLKKALDTLRQSMEILKTEPLSQPEGQLGQMAQTAYQQLLDNFDKLVETADS